MKPVEGYEGLYSVNIDGEVYSHRSQRFLKKTIDAKGYYRVWLTKKPVERSVKVARIVAAAFVDNPNQCETVDHIDGDKLNDRADNLDWCSFEENTKRSWKQGNTRKIIKGSAASWSKLTEEDVIEIRSLEGSMSQREIAKIFLITQQTVSDIITRRSWGHL